MLIFWTLVIGVVLGYMYGHYIRPNLRLREAIRQAKEKNLAILGEQNKGVYKTIITDHNQSSELVVEVKELAVTKSGQVKVAYVGATYKNPAFRTKKGEALLSEVRDLLGEYLPENEIEWYENKKQHTHISKNLDELDNLNKQHFEE